MFMRIAAMYQTTIRTSKMISTGARSAIQRGHRNRCGASACEASLVAGVLLVIGMPRAQSRAHALGDLQKRRRLADFEGAVAREIAGDDVDDAAGPRRHHHDPGRQEYRLGDRGGE